MIRLFYQVNNCEHFYLHNKKIFVLFKNENEFRLFRTQISDDSGYFRKVSSFFEVPKNCRSISVTEKQDK